VKAATLAVSISIAWAKIAAAEAAASSTKITCL